MGGGVDGQWLALVALLLTVFSIDVWIVTEAHRRQSHGRPVPRAGSRGDRAITAAFNAQTDLRSKLPLPSPSR